ncbi:MAG: zinc ribbon domain-containing protein [Candidatus Thorarchaeota archaeon]
MGQNFIRKRRNTMARSKGVVISVKVPINWEAMTKMTQQRLRQIVGRDTRAIRSFLGIIEHHEHELLAGRNRNRISDGKLDKLTLTAIKVKAGFSQRLAVPHDMKARFPRMSANELCECRQTAISQYESYLALRQKKGRKVSRPCQMSSTRRIPRWVFSQRFRLIEKPKRTIRWWLNLRDSLHSALAGRRIHDRIMIPLKISPFHLIQMKRGELKALQIFTDRYRKWWVTFAIRVAMPETPSEAFPLAVLGIDLGIEKAACATLVTSKGVSETRYFVQKEKIAHLKKYDGLVAKLQHERNTRKNQKLLHDGLSTKLKHLRAKRENVAKEYDRVLIAKLVDFIFELSERYTLFVAIGRLKNIRNTARRGNYKGKKFRGMIHSWAFARITETLKHQLAQEGWIVKGKKSRFHAIPENWTSIMCWKCGRKGYRPRQSKFVCSCGFRTNADRNGSLNIARRLIKLIPLLRNDEGLGRWAVPERAPAPKTGRKPSSKRKPSLPSKGQVSDLGESAAVHHAQMSLLDFGDNIRKGDDDPAVVNTMEHLSAVGCGTPIEKQETEARTEGGIQSQ